MKNIKLLSFALALTAIFGFNSCEEFDPGGTAVEAMCGEWVAYNPDEDHSFYMQTSNTANNEANKMIITDLDGNAARTGPGFWGFNVKADCNVSAKTFSCTDVTNGYWTTVRGVYTPYDILISIRNGKITEKAVELPSGVLADKIEFEIWFEDGGDEFYKIVGYRYSGFSEDDGFIYEGE